MNKQDNLPETVRNRLLRRVDWRFLLPSPTPERSICFADGLLAEAVALISQECVPASRPVDPVCDLAVALNPNAAVLQSAWRSLRPGGACYIEWYRPLLGGVQGVRQKLTQAGFAEVTCYWPWPWPTRANPLFWLPLESPTALAYFLANRPQAASIKGRILQTLYRQLWQVGIKTQLVMPICAVARKPTEASATHGSGKVSFVLLGSDPCSAPNARLLLTGGLRSINKVVELVFIGTEDQPRLVVKHARVPESIPALVREAAVLNAVHTGRGQAMAGVPQVLFARQREANMAVGESALGGVPIWTQMSRDNYRDLALQATAWLVDLAGATVPQVQGEWWERLVGVLLDDFQQNFGLVIDPNQVQSTRAALRQLGDLPLLCEHRDFSPWNVLLTGQGELAVLDWESAELQGLPGLDLIYFLTYLTFFVDGAMATKRFVETYRVMLQPTTPTGAVFHACVAYYARRLGLDPNCLHDLRLLVWLIHARSEYQHFCAEVAGLPPPKLLQQSLFVALWQEEVRWFSAKQNKG